MSNDSNTCRKEKQIRKEVKPVTRPNILGKATKKHTHKNAMHRLVNWIFLSFMFFYNYNFYSWKKEGY